MSRPGARAAAVALAVAALFPGSARPDPLADAEHGAGGVEELLRSVEEALGRPEATPHDVAVQKFSSGETQYLLGDWPHAALLMGEALDDPAFREGPQGATATFYLGDALRQAGSCGAARPYLDGYLKGGELAHRGEALAAALECAVRDEHLEQVGPLLAEADRYHQGQVPPEVRYLAAKATLLRTDLPPDERSRQADAAFAAVGAPYAHQAAYFQAVLRLERKDLPGAEERFAACAALPAGDARQREVQELCTLGVGRVKAEQGDVAGAISAYEKVPIDSPSFDEALYETAALHGRAGQFDPALRTVETLEQIEPDSPLAGRSRLLQGQLLLQQGQYDPATRTYEKLIGDYAPVRDGLDGVLALHADPARFFAELLARHGRSFEVASAVPAPAMREALAKPEVARAMGLVQALEEEDRDATEGRDIADRIGAALDRGGGIDAFPRLREGYGGVQAVENAAAVLQGLAASAAVEAAGPALDPDGQAELARVHGERLVLEGQLDSQPRTAEAVRSRLDRTRARMDALDREAFQLGYVVESARAAIAGTEAWLLAQRGTTQADRAQRDEVETELRKHREVVAGYEQDLRRLRQDIAKARDAAGGTEALSEEGRLRGEYLSLLAQERKVLDGARGRLSGQAQARFERAAALSDRISRVTDRARELSERIAGEASRGADGLRARLAAERAALDAETAALSSAQVESRGAVGQVVYRSFGEVRRELYEMVLRADVGLNDVAWTRKRDRVEQIQKLSKQQTEELKALDQRYGPALKEEE